jgi:hypothetical protein
MTSPNLCSTRIREFVLLGAGAVGTFVCREYDEMIDRAAGIPPL